MAQKSHYREIFRKLGKMPMNTKSVFTPYVARKLLHMGNPILDIKPMKENRDKTIFVFENTEKLQKDMASATQH